MSFLRCSPEFFSYTVVSVNVATLVSCEETFTFPKIAQRLPYHIAGIKRNTRSASASVSNCCMHYSAGTYGVIILSDRVYMRFAFCETKPETSICVYVMSKMTFNYPKCWSSIHIHIPLYILLSIQFTVVTFFYL